MLYHFYLLKCKETLIYFYCFSWGLSGLENVLLNDMQGYPTSDFDLLLQFHFPLHVLLLHPIMIIIWNFIRTPNFILPSSLFPSLPISFFPSSFLLFFLSLSFSPSCYLLSYPRMHFLNSHSSGNYLSNSSITLFLIIHFYSLWIPKYFICDYFSNTWSHLPHKAVRALRVDSGFISPYIQWRMSSKTICLQEVRDGERKGKKEIQEKIEEGYRKVKSNLKVTFNYICKVFFLLLFLFSL